jgi:hypothetical protein
MARHGRLSNYSSQSLRYDSRKFGKVAIETGLSKSACGRCEPHFGII